MRFWDYIFFLIAGIIMSIGLILSINWFMAVWVI